MSRLIGKPLTFNQNAGNFMTVQPINILGPIQGIIKIQIKSIKKLDNLMKYINELKLNLDQYDYGYVTFLQSEVVSFHLIKKIRKKFILLYIVFDDHNITYQLQNKLSASGYVIALYKK